LKRRAVSTLLTKIRDPHNEGALYCYFATYTVRITVAIPPIGVGNLYIFCMSESSNQTLTQQQLDAIRREEEILAEVISSLQAQLTKSNQRFRFEHSRARDLTAELVQSTRDEDKAMLASDEAVSHALKDNHSENISRIEQQLGRPYFARVVVKEERNGTPYEIEYKLGTFANPDCRIVDWRKAPIARLYYEYKEGDEYAEEIQGQEREGHVALRNTLEISKGQLVGLNCSLGSFMRAETGWQVAASGRAQATNQSDGFKLKDILALITPDQFDLITREAKTAILIQGIAGSGKTTVALHRLAWLLHEDNSPLKTDQALVVVHSKVLKEYISQILPDMGVSGVSVLTFSEWIEKVLTGNGYASSLFARENRIVCPASILRLKSSFAFLNLLEELTQASPSSGYRELLVEICSNPELILERDSSRLLTSELIQEALSYHKQNLGNSSTIDSTDSTDPALMLRWLQLRSDKRTRHDQSSEPYGHIMIDEVQDFNPAELAVLVSSVEKPYQLTLAGDTSQAISVNTPFPGWEQIRRYWSFSKNFSEQITLEVSFRSTLPIMRLASYVKNISQPKHGRTGRRPIWFRCRNEEEGFRYAIHWLQTAIDKYPNQMTAVICLDRAEAREVFKLLQPTFSHAIRLGTPGDFSFQEGIVVSDITTVKGLEFYNVLAWNVGATNFPAGQRSANLLYVAMTRAEENLALISWKSPAACLANCPEHLVRLYDLSENDPLEGARQ